MTDDEMLARMRRTYAALEAVIDEDPDSVSRSIDQAVSKVGMEFDASQGWDQAKLENHTFTLIQNIAHLIDHARRWIKDRGGDMKLVDDLVQSTKSIQILLDLSNADKHGGSKPLSQLYSGMRPTIKGLMRTLVLKSEPGPNQSAGVWFDADGKMHCMGTPSFHIWAVVMDEHNQVVGNLNMIMEDAIKSWEGLLRGVGLVGLGNEGP